MRLKLTARGRKALRGCGARPRVTIGPGAQDAAGSCGGGRARPRATPSRSRRRRAATTPSGSSRPASTRPRGCDFLDPAVCLQPWPNDDFTVADTSTATGRRLDLTAGAMPKNVAGKAIEPGDYNRNDGFSPGSPIHTKIPGLDNQAAFKRTGLVPETDMARSFDPGQPAVVIDADTGERQLIWAELDSQASTNADRNLFIRPGRNFREGHRYIVALRNLKRADGSTIQPQRPFRVYRDRIYTTTPRRRGAPRAHGGPVRRARPGRHRARRPLPRVGLHGRQREEHRRPPARHPRPGARRPRRRRADERPRRVPAGDPTEHPADPEITRVCGTFTVPCFLDSPAARPARGSQFADATSNDPVADRRATRCSPTTTASCRPRRPATRCGWRSTATGCSATPPRSTSRRSARWSSGHGFAYCATDWKGMATEDDAERRR